MPKRPVSPFLAILAVGLGTTIVPLDSSVNIAFPDITRSFGIPLDAIQWVVICYVLTYSSLMLVCGKLGDLFGHRRIFRIGLALSIVAFWTIVMTYIGVNYVLTAGLHSYGFGGASVVRWMLIVAAIEALFIAVGYLAHSTVRRGAPAGPVPA